MVPHRGEELISGSNKEQRHPVGCLCCFRLYLQVDSCKEGAWSSGTIDKARIAIHALVEIGLELIQDILYTCINLQCIVLVERNIIA